MCGQVGVSSASPASGVMSVQFLGYTHWTSFERNPWPLELLRREFTNASAMLFFDTISTWACWTVALSCYCEEEVIVQGDEGPVR